MGTFSIWHWLIVLVVVLVLFGGRGKLSQLMGDMAKGITAFKKGLKEENAVEADDETKVLKSDSSSASSETVKKDETA
jgi:sec-independent protein translocase protein TatA